MLAATDDAIGALRHECGKPVDLREAMQRLALDIALLNPLDVLAQRRGLNQTRS